MQAQGFTLMELAVVLAVIAVLATILSPVVVQYVDEARVVRAQMETKTIAAAILLHHRDTSRFPVYAAMSTPTTDTEILFGPGASPTFTGGSWLSGFFPIAPLQTRLNTNFFNLPTTAGAGRVAYHGPYTSGIGSDPWGRRYVAEVGPAPGSAHAAFVVSAGPDGIVQTTRVQPVDGFVVSGDDIVSRIK